MGKFYEVIYETGSMAVLDASDEESTKEALAAHHKRAMNGEPGQLPSSQSPHPDPTVPFAITTHPAERIKKVFVYDAHPADLSEQLASSKDVFSKHVKELIAANTDENGVVDRIAVANALYVPVVDPNAARHESRFVAEGKELDLSFLPKD